MRVYLTVAMMLLAATVSGQVRQCKTNPKVVGACYVAHGRATFGPGTPALRIWLTGTKSMLGVTAGPIADDADEPICPRSMLTDPTDEVFGDFEVCPFTPKRQGHMQMVCVECAKNLVV
jgi:hypothetical protein